VVTARTAVVALAEALIGSSARSAGEHNVMFLCPFHTGGSHGGWSFTLNIFSGACQCHSCKVGFSSLKYLAIAMNRTDDLELLAEIAKIQPVQRAPSLSIMESIPLTVLYLMDDPYEKMPQFPKWVLDDFHVRYDPGIDALVYPIYDIDGRFVRIHCRMCDPDAYLRYRFFTPDDYARYDAHVEEDESLGKRHAFINGQRVIRNVMNDVLKEVVICEGPKQAMRVYEAGFWNVIAPMGGMGSEQYAMLQLLDCSFFTFFDNDDGGDAAHAKFFKKIIGCSTVRKVGYGDSPHRQPDDMSVEEIETLLVAAGATKPGKL
jgi:5S rRNA maturation endonuclease (ribonuclease M5)